MAEQKAGGYSTRYRFTSKEIDEQTGLYYFGARYYNPSISLWYGVDPLAERSLNWNPYRYCFNNPINILDPSGMNEEDSDNDPKDPKIKKNNDPQQPPVPQKPIEQTKSDPNAPPPGQGVIAANIPPQIPGINAPMASGSLGDPLDISDAIPAKGALKIGGKLTAAALFGVVVKESIKEGTEEVLSKKVSGWVKRSIFQSLDKSIQKKIAAAIEKGIVAPTGKQGIIKLSATEAAETGYQYKIKILGKGGDVRIYGNTLPNGHIIFDKIMKH